MGKGGDKRRGSGPSKNPSSDDTWLQALLESNLNFRAEWNSENVVSLLPPRTEENTPDPPSTNHSTQGSVGGSESPQHIPEAQEIEHPYERNEDDRMVIVPGDFLVNKTVRDEVQRINKVLFDGKATRFLGIQNARDIYWEQLQQRFRWAPEHNSKVLKKYFGLVESAYRKKMNRIRAKIISKSIPDFKPEEDYSRLIPFRPAEIGEQNWRNLCTVWNTPEWKKKSKAGSKNQRGKLLEGEVTTRSSLGTKTKSQLLREMSAQLGRQCRFDEFLLQMCTNSKTGQPYHTRHYRILNKYCEIVRAKNGEDHATWPVFDMDAWIEASGGVQKGDLWTAVPLEFSNPEAFIPATRTTQADKSEVNHLKDELEKQDERMNAKFGDLEKKLSKERKRNSELVQEIKEFKKRFKLYNAALSNIHRGLVKKGLIEECEMVATGSGSKNKSCNNSKARRQTQVKLVCDDSDDSSNSLSSNSDEDSD